VVDGDIDTLVANLGETSPTWMGAVPRIFEKAYNKIVTGAREAGGVKAKLFFWAVDIGRQVSRLRQDGKEPTGLLKLKYGIADKLVFSKVKATFGGKLRFFVSGGAPLSKEIAEFFHACDILILEGYGLSESSAATTLNPPDAFKFGTVGQPIPGTDIKIAEDGEILMSGRGIMKGYYNNEEATAESLSTDADGKVWLRTGDIGTVLDSGHVKITDRKKEIIITAGGKNIAPAHVQNKLKARCLYVSEVLMHGDKRNFCVALIAINEDSVGKWAAKNGIAYTDYADLAGKSEVKALIWEDMKAINEELPSYETIKKIALLPEDMSVENGQLTPSMKVKRRIVEDTYKDILDGFYSDTVAAM
jgi:long-chain acyl-CoA synthetase